MGGQIRVTWVKLESTVFVEEEGLLRGWGEVEAEGTAREQRE